MRVRLRLRHHPLLGYMQDAYRRRLGRRRWARRSSPSGNGIIDKVGWEGGYGKYIRIRHANGYETAYGHMSAFARSMDRGKQVRQGQVIGYVGSTGLSTGAHLHYEILVNGRFVDPMRSSCRAAACWKARLAGFDQERDRLDNMMAAPAARSRYAQSR